MKITTTLLSLVLLVGIAATSCRKTKKTMEQNMSVIEKAVDTFADNIRTYPPTSTTDLDGRLHDYINFHPAIFYGSTVTLFDSNGKAAYSPYYYRTNGRIAGISLMDPSYNIDNQGWLREPIARGYAVWTDPYFDAGGGNIWMRTRSVPVFVNGKIFAVVTTDLQVDHP